MRGNYAPGFSRTFFLQVCINDKRNYFHLGILYAVNIPICDSSICCIKLFNVLNLSPQPEKVQLFWRKTAICISVREYLISINCRLSHEKYRRKKCFLICHKTQAEIRIKQYSNLIFYIK